MDVVKKILDFRDWLEAQKQRFLAHPPIAAIVFVVGAPLAIQSWIENEPPWVVLLSWLLGVWARMTLSNAATFLIFLAAAASAWSLVLGYYEQRTKVAEQEARVMERDRDCDVLAKHLEEQRRLVRLAEAQRDVAVTDRDTAATRITELEQTIESHPFEIRAIRGELRDVSMSRAQILMENLVLLTSARGWHVSVVVRFLDYDDRKMADDVQSYLLSLNREWSVLTKHEPGDTIRPVFDMSRMEMTSAADAKEWAGRMCFALSTGRYWNLPFPHVAGEVSTGVVITIFPRQRESAKGVDGETN